MIRLRPRKWMTGKQEVEFMQQPWDWSVWPFLPLKGAGRGTLMCFDGKVAPEVYLGNYLELVPSRAEIVRYDSFEALNEAGWVIA